MRKLAEITQAEQLVDKSCICTQAALITKISSYSLPHGHSDAAGEKPLIAQGFADTNPSFDRGMTL